MLDHQNGNLITIGSKGVTLLRVWATKYFPRKVRLKYMAKHRRLECMGNVQPSDEEALQYKCLKLIFQEWIMQALCHHADMHEQ